MWRKLQRLRRFGREGLVHKLLGRRSNRAKAESVKTQVCRLWEEFTRGSPMSIYRFHRKVIQRANLPVSYRTILRWLKKSS